MSDRSRKGVSDIAQLEPDASDQFFLRRADILAKIAQERYSCRAFLPFRVSQQTIETILLIAQRSASCQNIQPWEVVVTGVSATDRLRKLFIQYADSNKQNPDLPPPTLEGEHKLRAKSLGDLRGRTQRSPPEGAASGEDELREELGFFGAPHLALVATPKRLGNYGILDCGAYISNFLFAAQSMGVSAIAQASLASYPDFWREQLRLRQDRLILCAISFGYENADHPANRCRTPRVPISKAVTWLHE